jgi:hypothetical protein
MHVSSSSYDTDVVTQAQQMYPPPHMTAHVSSSSYDTDVVATETQAQREGDEKQERSTLALDIGASPGGWSRFLAENVGCRCVLAVGGFFGFLKLFLAKKKKSGCRLALAVGVLFVSVFCVLRVCFPVLFWVCVCVFG